MNLVIIESPYAGEVTRNVSYAKAALRNSLLRGEAPFASHLLYTQVLDDDVPDERTKGIDCGYAWMCAADCVAFYVDYGWSAGMIRALKVTRILGKRFEIRHMLDRKPPAPSDEVRSILHDTRRT